MIQTRIAAKRIQRTACTVFIAASAKHDAPNASVDHEACAHRTRFKGDNHSGVLESPGTNRGSGIANCQEFRVRGRILRLFALVMTSSDDLAVDDNDGTDRYFALFASESCFIDGQTHEVVIGELGDAFLFSHFVSDHVSLTAFLAEGVGFEPTVSFPTHAFQACRFGRSRTPPGDQPTGPDGIPVRQGIVPPDPLSRVAVGSCAIGTRESSQGRKAAALNGTTDVPQVA